MGHQSRVKYAYEYMILISFLKFAAHAELSASSKCQSLRLAAVELHFMRLEKYSLSWNLDCLLFYDLLSDDVLAAFSSLLFYPISELTIYYLEISLIDI